jgi:hypothetical protein
VARHPDAVTRHEYGVFVSRRTGVELDVVLSAVEEAVRRTGERPDAGSGGEQRLSGEEKAEREYLRLMLANHPGIRPLEVEPAVFSSGRHAAAFELLAPVLEALDPGVPPDLGSLLGDPEDELGGLLAELALVDRPLADPAEIARRLKVSALGRRIDALERDVSESDAAGAPEDRSEALSELIALQNEKRKLWGPE